MVLVVLNELKLRNTLLLCAMYLFLITNLKADLKSNTGSINFDVNSDQQKEMVLNSVGLGIGTTPSANLHVVGNAIIQNKLSIGATLGSSNLHVEGTVGLSSYLVTSVTTDWQDHSIVLVDTSSDNIILNLPAVVSNVGRVYQFKKISTLNQFSIQSSDNIDTMSEIMFSANTSTLAYLQVISDGTTWHALDMVAETALNPSILTGLKAWYKSDMGTWQDASKTLAASAVNDPVYVWEDQSGHGNDAVVAADANRPLLSSANQIYGRLTLQLDGVDDYFNVPDIRGSAGDQYAYVVSQRKYVTGSTWQRLISSWDGVSGDDYLGSGWSILGDHSTGTAIVYSPKISTVTGTDHTIINIRLGSNASANNQFLHGNLAEVLIFDTIPTSEEDAQILEYLTLRWGL